MKKILIFLLAVFVLIQFFQIDKTNPTTNNGMDFLRIKNTPEPIAKIIKNSCYDCHSNETKYPSYSYMQPAGWLLKNHIEEGRKKLNFSTFATYDVKRQVHKLDEAAEYVEQKKMPLESYTLIHTDAKLSNDERKQLVDYFRMVQKKIQQAHTL